MKKFLVLFLVALATILLVKPHYVSAASVIDDDYRNLNILDFSLLKIENGKLKSDQKFFASQGECITFIASTSFFGSAYNSQTNSLTTGTEIVLAFQVDDPKNTGYSYHLPIKYYNPGIIAASQQVACDGNFYVGDFLARIDSIDDLDKDHVMMYKGELTEFKGFVNQEANPELEYYDQDTLIIHTDCTNPISVADLKNSIYAYDYVDGLISGNQMQVLTDTYTANKSVGEHVMEFKASDRSGNTRVLKVIISVEDKEPPTISLPTQIQFELCGRLITIEDVRSYFEITDNNDGIIPNTKLYGFKFLGLSFDGYTCRRYTFEIKCDDNAGNTASLVCAIQTVDTTAPVIKLKTLNVKLSEYYNGFLSLEPYQYFEYVNDYSGKEMTYYFDTEFEDEGDSIGDVNVTARVVDYYGNVGETTGVFHIIDDIAPMFYVKGDLIQTDVNMLLSIRELHSRIKQELTRKGINYDQVIMVDSNYFENAQTPGIYEIKYAYKNGDEITYQYSQIEVLEKLADVTVEEKQPYTPIETNVDTSVTNQDNTNNWLYLLLLIPVIFLIIYFINRKKHQTIR